MNDQRFTFLCTQNEREQLTQLANFYHRSQSDTIRMLIRNAIQAVYREMEKEYFGILDVEDDIDERDPSNIFG